MGEVGKEQCGGTGIWLSARLGHCSIRRKKFQRLVGVAGHQVVEVTAQGRESALGGGDGDTGIRYRGIAKGGQQLLDGIGEFGDAVEPDDGQRAMRLVHAGARLGQAVACRIGGVGGETLARALEGQVDFSLDPGQRTDVEFDAHGLNCRAQCVMDRLFKP